MTRSGWITIALFFSILIPCPSFANMSLGANVSLATFLSTLDDADFDFMFSAPSDLVYGIQPGLRLGFFPTEGQDEIYFETGVLAVGSSTYWALTANYQRLLLRSPTSPYLTVGGGFNAYGFLLPRQTNPVFGAGIGVRHALGHGHGAVRGELRYDAIQLSAYDEETFSSIGLKLGFDLWLQ